MIKWAPYLVGLATAFLLVAGGSTTSASPSRAGQWAPIQRVPGYAAETEPPYLVADRNRTVHAFVSQPVGGTMAVVYRRWSLAGGWTDPVDVLLAPDGGDAKVTGAYLDLEDKLHVVFFGGSDRTFGIYHSWAPAGIADRAPNWATPVPIGDGAGPLSFSSLVGDGNGNMYLVYSGKRAGLGLYAIRSSDSGRTWSKPEIIFLTYSVKHGVAWIGTQLDSRDRLHVVWTIVNDSGNGDAVYYSALDEKHESWSQPFLMAAKTGATAERPTVTQHNNEMFVTYTNATPPTTWMRRSGDGGRSWSDPIQIIEGWVGGNGTPNLVHDSSGTLHLFFGNRTYIPPKNDEIHGMWRSVWDGARWSRPEAIISGPQRMAKDGEAFDPWSPSAVVSQGNVLLLTWNTDPGAGKNGVWYTYVQLGTPELPLVALSPSAAAKVAEEPPPAAPPSFSLDTPGAVRSALPEKSKEGVPRTAALADTAAPPWLFNILPVALLIVVAVGAKLLISQRR